MRGGGAQGRTLGKARAVPVAADGQAAHMGRTLTHVGHDATSVYRRCMQLDLFEFSGPAVLGSSC